MPKPQHKFSPHLVERWLSNELTLDVRNRDGEHVNSFLDPYLSCSRQAAKQVRFIDLFFQALEVAYTLHPDQAYFFEVNLVGCQTFGAEIPKSPQELASQFQYPPVLFLWHDGIQVNLEEQSEWVRHVQFDPSEMLGRPLHDATGYYSETYNKYSEEDPEDDKYRRHVIVKFPAKTS